MSFYEWLQKTFKNKKGYRDDRFGDLARNIASVVKKNPFEEDFDDYVSIEDWQEHLDMHLAPKSVKATLLEAWEIFENTGVPSEIDSIRGEDDEGR